MEHNNSELVGLLLDKHEREEDSGALHKSARVTDAEADASLKYSKQEFAVENGGVICSIHCGLARPENEAADAEVRTAATRKLIYAIVFCLLFMIVEIAGGLLANSLAVLTDAAHLLSDVAGFAVSLFAIWASSWQATARQTYGYHRVEILGALVSIQIIWLITGILVYQAFDRILHNEHPVHGLLMFSIATLGLLVNIVMIFILGHDHDHHGHGHKHGQHEHDHTQNDESQHHGGQHEHENDESQHKYAHSQRDNGLHKHCHNHAEYHHDHAQGETDLGHGHQKHKHECVCTMPDDIECKHSEIEAENSEVNADGEKFVASSSKNINIRGAYLHVFGDLVQSIGVMVAGAAIWYNPNWKILDLVCTLLFSLLVLITTINMLRDILEVLMESTPREIDARVLETGLLELDNVVAVHDLHIWAITLGKTLLACHVRIAPYANSNEVLQSVIDYCKNRYNISHVTIQVEHD